MRLGFLVAIIVMSMWSNTTAQTIVSTEPSNRNVVLEEFTGMYCGWCPDGHRVANELAEKYKGRFFPINIHADYYGTPQKESDLDLRTEVGLKLDTMAGADAYPTGSINRNTKPWAQRRIYWEENAESVLSQPSPVNLAVKADANLETRELSVLVEYYYTSDEVNPTNNLSLMLTQSEILGYQVNAENLNPDFVTEEGDYRHQHTLRMCLTESIWGDQISETKAGTFGKKEYKIILPEKIRDIDLDLTKLEVIAFIAPDKADIITAAGTRVTIPDENMVMLSLEDMSNISENYFYDTFNPKVKVTNLFDTEVTQFDIKVIANEKTYTKTFKGSLKKDESTIVDFGDLLAEYSGNYYIKIEGFHNINNSDETGKLVVDMDLFDNYVTYNGLHFHRKAFDKTTFSFEKGSGNFGSLESENTRFLVSHATYPIGAKKSRDALLFHLHENYEIEGKKAEYIFGEANLTILDDAKLYYYYAYSHGDFGKTDPSIIFSVSEDDGETWKEIANHTPQHTQQGTSSGTYVPSSSDYIQDSISLKDYFGKAVLVKLSVVPGTGGNALWIDEISFDGTYKNITEISTDKKEIDFGYVTVGTDKTEEITIINSGAAELEIYSIQVLYDDYNVFKVEEIEANTKVAVGESIKVKVSFEPKENDLYISQLAIKSNDPLQAFKSASLVGEGEGNSVLSSKIDKNTLKLMPNPVTDAGMLSFDFSSKEALTCDLQLIDISGQNIKEIGSYLLNSGKNTISIDLSDISSGKYFLLIRSNKSILNQLPVIIER